MKRILAIALLLCSRANAQQLPKVASPPAAPPGIFDTLNDGFQQLAHIPWMSAEDINLSAFGVSIGRDGLVPTGDVPTIRNQIVQNYRGTGIVTTAADGRIIDCISHHNYVGARIGSSDSEIRGCRLYNNRDACLWIASNAGNCQSNQNHCYGARIACYNEGGAMFRSVNDTYADAYIGHLGDVKGGGSNQTMLTNCLFQHNTVRDCVFKATGCHLLNCIVNVQRDVKKLNTIDIPGVGSYAGKVGVELGWRCSIRSGQIVLTNWKHPHNEYSGKPAEAIWIRGDDVVLDTMLVDDDGLDGSIGIRTKGARRGLRVDCFVNGFQQPNDRLLIIENAARTNGLDITFRINGAVKPIGGYIQTGPGWTGSIRLIDTSNGKIISLPEGQATKAPAFPAISKAPAKS
jgi:hypothetical protein